MLNDEALLATIGYTLLHRSQSGGCVYIHETHGKAEARQNVPIAVFLAELGEWVCLLQVVNEPGAKNPDATRNGVEWKFKTPEGLTSNAVDKALRGASKQADRILLHVSSEFSVKLLEQALHNRVRRATNIVEVAIYWQSRLFHFSRQEIIHNTFRGKME